MAHNNPYAVPILADKVGKVVLQDMIDGESVSIQVDEVTGLTRRTVIEPKNAELRPRLEIHVDDRAGSIFTIPVGVNIVINDGDTVEPGDVLAKIPRDSEKTKDITGGLPRVAELFEARKPKESSIIADFEGVISFGNHKS